MSEPENQPNPPSTPKTSAVPLKKETVRITLRARPGAPGATQPREATAPAPVAPVAKVTTAPIQLPSTPLPPPAPKSATAPVKLPPAPVAPAARPPVPVAPVAAAPVPSAPPSAAPVAAPRPAAPPAATVPMAPPRPPGGAPVPPRPVAPAAPGAAAPRVETGSATAPLTKPAAPRPPVTGAAATGAAAGGAGLPKATVKLQQTQPISGGRPPVTAPPSALSKRPAPAADSQQFYEEKDPEEGLMVPALLCFVLSVVLLGIQALGTDRFSAGPPPRVPEAQPQAWERQAVKGGDWTNDFKLPEVSAAR